MIKRSIHILMAVIIIFTCVAPIAAVAVAPSDTPDWLGTSTLHTSKIQDMLPNKTPWLHVEDCYDRSGSNITFAPTTSRDTQYSGQCYFPTGIGAVGFYGNTLVRDGVEKRLQAYSKVVSQPGEVVKRIYSSPINTNTDYLLMRWTEPDMRPRYFYQYDYLGIIRNPDASDVHIGKDIYGADAYVYDKQPDEFVRYEGSDERVLFLSSTVAVSNNGRWIVVIANDRSTVLIDANTMRARVIGSEASDYIGFDAYYLQGANLAVSDDGRFVVGSAAEPTAPALKIYDTQSCNYTDPIIMDTSPEGMPNHPFIKSFPCAYKNVWLGTLMGSRRGRPLADQFGSVGLPPGGVRFSGRYSIRFNIVSDFVNYESFKVTRYEAKVSGGGQVVEWGSRLLPPADVIEGSGYTDPEAVSTARILAMGDSYISGEGAHHYVYGTDTSENRCHLSELSYPYILGGKYADEFHSVACSGAKMKDVLRRNDKVDRNQLSAEDLYKDFDGSPQKLLIQESWTPGAIEQYNFVSAANPNAILLSIGGNDIGFEEMVEQCVISIVGNPCYDKRSERASILMTIYGKHNDLVRTYKKIITESSSGTRLYVIGYPQVINPTGNCGVNVHFDDQERKFAVQLIDHLNAAIKNAAESVGAYYVDNADALNGHRLCDGSDNGVNGLTAGNDNWGIGNESYHPTALGHAFLSASVSTKTDKLTARPKAATNSGQLAVNSSEPFITEALTDRAEARKITFGKIVERKVDQVVAAGSTIKIAAKKSYGFVGGKVYKIVFHSEEVVVATGVVPDDGNIDLTVAVPDITPGIHSIHIYTEDELGEPIDITENIFIIASEDDYDGDGIKNPDDALPYINKGDKIIVSEPTSATINGATGSVGSQNQVQTSLMSRATNASPISGNKVLATIAGFRSTDDASVLGGQTDQLGFGAVGAAPNNGIKSAHADKKAAKVAARYAGSARDKTARPSHHLLYLEIVIVLATVVGAVLYVSTKRLND